MLFRSMKASVDELSKNVAIGLGVSLALPYAAGAGIASGMFSLNALGWSAVLNASADLTAQMITTEGSFSERARQVNITSVVASGIMENPFGGEIVGSSLKWTINSGFNESYVFGKMRTSEFIANVTVSGVLGTYGDVGLHNAGISTFTGTKNMRYFFSRSGVKMFQGTMQYSIGTLTNTTSNIIQDALNTSDTTKKTP